MKYLYALLIAPGLLSSAPVSAQEWCAPGATWIFDTGSPWSTSSTRFAYAGDTLVDGHVSQRIAQNGVITELFGNDTVIPTSGPPTITRTAPGVVWQWRADAARWDTLYWFAALPGDSWVPAWAFGDSCPPDHRLVVMDTGSITTEGIELRNLSVQRFIGNDPVGDVEEIIERMGNVNGFFNPISTCGPIYECYCTFMCYRDDQIGSSSCALPTGITDVMRTTNLAPFPNPGSDVIAVSGMDDSKRAYLIAVDALGVEHALPSPSTGYFDVSSLSAGAYFLRELDPLKKEIRRSCTWIKVAP